MVKRKAKQAFIGFDQRTRNTGLYDHDTVVYYAPQHFSTLEELADSSCEYMGVELAKKTEVDAVVETECALDEGPYLVVQGLLNRGDGKFSQEYVEYGAIEVHQTLSDAVNDLRKHGLLLKQIKLSDLY